MKTDKEMESRLLVIYAYEHFIDSFQHYNNMQVKFRSYVFTWFFAMFFGMGYAFSSKEVGLPIDPLVIGMFIVIAAGIGIFLVWYQDLIVCERFIASIVHQEKQLEEMNAWLPRIIETSNDLYKLIGYVSMKGWFYIGCFLILFISFFIPLFVLINYYSMTSLFLFFTSFLLFFYLIFLLIFFLQKALPLSYLVKLRKKNNV
jgi:hypothetical protein